MKKIVSGVAILLCVVLMFGLVGCSLSENSTSAKKAEISTSPSVDSTEKNPPRNTGSTASEQTIEEASAEEEAAKLEAERLVAEEEAARIAAEEEAARIAADEEAAKLEAERLVAEEEAAAAANQSQNNDITVYITKTGEKYHSDGCSYLAKSQIPINLSDAKARGYGPCSRCTPG